MNNLYQGGQCGPNMMGPSSNQFKTMMNGLGMGSQNPERVLEMAQKGQSFEEDILARQMMFKTMNQQWAQSQGQVNQQHMQMQQMMNTQHNIAIEEQRRMQMMHEMNWMQAQQHIRNQQMMMHQQFENMSILQQAEKWKNQMKMDNAFSQAKVSYEEQQATILNSSESMLDVMMNDPDPRFQNSQFLHFLKRIQKGEIVIEGKQMRQVKPDMAMMQSNQKLMNQNWNAAELIHKSNLANLDVNLQQAKQKQYEEGLKSQQMLQKNWQQKLMNYEQQYANSAQFEKMLEQKYMDVLKQMNLDLGQAWNAASDMEEQLVHGDIKTEYMFDPNNPYKDVAFPKKMALDLINQGNNNQAILALEAHLQRQPNDGETWRILGRILQQNDQDQKSIPCFTNCLKANPNNLDCLLSLGVSCTNVLDEVKAMNYLKRWIMLNPKYKIANIDHIIPDEMINMPTYKIQQIKQINDNLIRVFDDAAKMNPNDSELLTSLAILFFIKRQYQASIDLFNRALNLDPTNYLLMNKVGATLAHLGRADEAIKYYHKALDIRPNYVRVWVNIGIAHAFKGLYEEAASFYLNALSFRPDAKHIWSYLHTCFLSLQRYDLIGQISTQNPHSFTDFDVINLNDLPHPQISYQLTTEKHILNRESSAWLSEFEKK